VPFEEKKKKKDFKTVNEDVILKNVVKRLVKSWCGILNHGLAFKSCVFKNAPAFLFLQVFKLPFF
jgi:hypothetical protein